MNHFAQRDMPSGWMGPAQFWPTRAAQFNNVYQAPPTFQYSYNQVQNIGGNFASGHGHHLNLGHQNGGTALSMPYYTILPQYQQATGPIRARAPALGTKKKNYNVGIPKPIKPVIRPGAEELNPDEDLEPVRNKHVVCEWATAAGPCRQVVLGRKLWSHIQNAHRNDVGRKMMCRLPNCHYPRMLQRDSMPKHLGVHLNVRTTCRRCGYSERQDVYLTEHGLARNCQNPRRKKAIPGHSASASEVSTPGPRSPSTSPSQLASSSTQSNVRYSPYPTAGVRMTPHWTAPQPMESWDPILASTVDSPLALQAWLWAQQYPTSSQFTAVNQPHPQYQTHIPISPVDSENALYASQSRAQVVDLTEANPIPAVADSSLSQSPEDDATFSNDSLLFSIPDIEQPAAGSSGSIAIPSHNEDEAAASSTVVQHAGTPEISSQSLDAFDLFNLGPDLNALAALDDTINFSARLQELEAFYAPLAQL